MARLGMGFLELTVLIEEMGRVMLPGPFFSTAVIGGLAFLEAGAESQKKEYLPQIAGGQIKVTLALNEAESIYDPGVPSHCFLSFIKSIILIAKSSL